MKADDLPWCNNGPECTADVHIEGRQHHDCPDSCGQSTTQKGRVIRQCQTCKGSGFCVTWLTRTSTWSCARCRQRAWERSQADREPRRQELEDMYQHERGAGHGFHLFASACLRASYATDCCMCVAAMSSNTGVLVLMSPADLTASACSWTKDPPTADTTCQTAGQDGECSGGVRVEYTIFQSARRSNDPAGCLSRQACEWPG